MENNRISRELCVSENLAETGKVSEEEIVEVLKYRYERGQIYTFAGPALVSVNPIGLAGRGLGVNNAETGDVPMAHVLEMASRARAGALKGRSQAIILSGESGAGKTVNANRILADLGGSAALGRCLNHSAAVLEAFGNACTKHNENSSRFGKYVEVFYQGGVVSGARIRVFLLEKSRAPALEGNFHVLQMMRAGVVQGSEEGLQGVERVFGYCRAMGLARNTRLDLFRVLLSLVMLLETKLVSNGEKCWFQNKPEEVVQMLGLEKDALDRLVLQREIVVGREVIVRSRSLAEAETVRETLIRAMYERVFAWLVEEINRALSTPPLEVVDDSPESFSALMSAAIQRQVDLLKIKEDESDRDKSDRDKNDRNESGGFNSAGESSSNEYLEGSTAKIGVLDIYGFEVLDDNGLDQLCINYANEKMQAEYLRRVVVENRDAFLEEGIVLDRMPEPPRAEDLFEGPMGLVQLLDEESFLPGGSSRGWLQKISHAGLARTRGDTFEIEHYAGQVTYNACDFVEKNRNAYGEIYDLLNQTGIPALCTKQSYRGKMARVGVVGEFQKSLQGLLQEIDQCEVHYVRCLKPSSTNEFSEEYVRNRLRDAAVFETIKIYMLGFFARMDKTIFTQTYGEEPPEHTGIQIGRKHVFITQEAYQVLENDRAARLLAEKLEKERLEEERLEEERLEKERLDRERLEKERLEKERLEKERLDKERLENANLKDTKVDTKVDARVTTQEETDLIASQTSKQTIYEIVKLSQQEMIEKNRPIETILALSANTPALPTQPPSIEAVDLFMRTPEPFYDSKETNDSEDYIKSFQYPPLTSECTNCAAIEEKYAFQTNHLICKEQEIESLKAEALRATETIKEKDLLVQELSRKVELLLRELSSGEYSKVSTNPHTTIPLETKKSLTGLFKRICQLFVESIPSSYESYHQSVCCGFALMRAAAACPGGLPTNAQPAFRVFEASAHSVLTSRRISPAIASGFFLANAVFLARTRPGKPTSDMLQGIFFASCRALSEEIAGFGMEFLFKSSTFEPANILARLLKKPSIESVISHLKMVHSVLSRHRVPKSVISAIFEYIIKIIDTQGFEYLIKRDKKLTTKNLLHLDRSLDSLSESLVDMQIEEPFRSFVYLRAFLHFVAMQKDGLFPSPVCLQIGILTASQTLAAINVLAPEAKGESLHKLEKALQATAGVPEKPTVPCPILSAPLNYVADDPDLLYNALFFCPQRPAICEALQDFSISTDWLDK
ncbi:myosin V [Nematocida homosporus]|uniref:myosin V n=1 Tax=Nematocida homosporus TaxID=1912981 RepID=UPI00221F7004|nr:myosin V [Nematocida homosporus]KAI5185869.1 myosin V [Nematocida homosporus]